MTNEAEVTTNKTYDFPIIIKWVGYDYPMQTIIRNTKYNVDKFLEEIDKDVFCELVSIEHYEIPKQ